MKKIKFLFLALLLSFLTITSIDAKVERARHQHQNTVGTPLDGGLLAILAATGIAYYTARSKKKSKWNK